MELRVKSDFDSKTNAFSCYSCSFPSAMLEQTALRLPYKPVSLAPLPHPAPISPSHSTAQGPPHHEHSGRASRRDNHSRTEGGAPKRKGGVRHRYCSLAQFSNMTQKKRERKRKMELALQPSLPASLCWRQRDGGSSLMGKRVGGRGSSSLLQKPQPSLKAPPVCLDPALAHRLPLPKQRKLGCSPISHPILPTHSSQQT